MDNKVELLPACDIYEISEKAQVEQLERLKKDLYNDLPDRILRNAKKGDYNIEHHSTNFIYSLADKAKILADEIKTWLISKGYDATFEIEDYNSYFYYILFKISWRK